jgi:hypothetical protein
MALCGQTKTSDGSLLHLDAMIFWSITDTRLAVSKGMDVVQLDGDVTAAAAASAGGKRRRKSNLSGSGDDDDDDDKEFAHIDRASRNIDSLRMTVLRFAKAHLVRACAVVCAVVYHSCVREM